MRVKVFLYNPIYKVITDDYGIIGKGDAYYGNIWNKSAWFSDVYKQY